MNMRENRQEACARFRKRRGPSNFALWTYPSMYMKIDDSFRNSGYVKKGHKDGYGYCSYWHCKINMKIIIMKNMKTSYARDVIVHYEKNKFLATSKPINYGKTSNLCSTDWNLILILLRHWTWTGTSIFNFVIFWVWAYLLLFQAREAWMLLNSWLFSLHGS